MYMYMYSILYQHVYTYISVCMFLCTMCRVTCAYTCIYMYIHVYVHVYTSGGFRVAPWVPRTRLARVILKVTYRVSWSSGLQSRLNSLLIFRYVTTTCTRFESTKHLHMYIEQKNRIAVGREHAQWFWSFCREVEKNFSPGCVHFV